MIHATWYERVVLLTIDRQERRNALDTEHCRRLLAAADRASVDGARVVVITGAGTAFCAGADLGGVHDEDFRTALRTLLDRLPALPLPVVAAVNGPALGAGTELAISADLRVVDATARFGIPAGRLGLAVHERTVRRLVRVVGDSVARGILLAGAELDADAALRLGFAHRGGTVDEALAWAAEISALAPLTLRAHKLAVERAGGGASDDAEVAALVRTAWESDDLREGHAAFRERRPPRFEGR